VISPWAKANYVDHTFTEQASITQFIEDNWNLGRIGGGSFDASAGTLDNMFDFNPSDTRSEGILLDDQTGQVTGAVASAPSTVGGTVPATLSLSLGAPPSFGAFTPGSQHTYGTALAATITSSAGSSTLSVQDPSTTAPGHLVNGAFSLNSALQVDATDVPNPTATFASLDGGPLALLTDPGPVSNDPVQIGFQQPISSTDPLRTGTYSKTLTFTLSTTNP
jgi:hypothetical protein